MAPFEFSHSGTIWITLAIGFGFGFVLERSGFGNANTLAAQFYLHNMRVLKVMFTAIVTAMVLLFAASALGWVDFHAIWVPPTHLWPAVIGGLILGFGFIIGGYCPGTSLVAASTFKIDGLLFAVGVLVGLLLFGEASPALWSFYNASGSLGRLTLFDLVGVDAGWIVLGVAVMALGAFAFAELMERLFAREPLPTSPLRAASLWRRGAMVTLLLLAVLTIAIGQPTTERQMAWQKPTLDARLQSREIHIDPEELLFLIHDNQAQLLMLDVRKEADYNLFHLADARNVTVESLDNDVADSISREQIVVVMSNDEKQAEQAWRRLAVHPDVNAYVLAGGVNHWLQLYHHKQANMPGPEVASLGEGQFRYRFEEAFGSRLEAARPEPSESPRPFVSKVKRLKAVHAVSGGCG